MTAVRAFVRADADAVAALNDAAFGGPGEARLVAAVRGSGDVLAELVAEEGGALVGHILFSRATVEDGAERTPVAVLAPMAVAPARQRGGVGSALAMAGVARLKQAGERLVFVLGHADYYPRFGFSHAAAAAFDSPYAGDAGPAHMALALAPDAPTRGRLVYAAAFSELA